MAKYKWYKNKKNNDKWFEGSKYTLSTSGMGASLTPEILESAWSAVYENSGTASPMIINESAWNNVVSAWDVGTSDTISSTTFTASSNTMTIDASNMADSDIFIGDNWTVPDNTTAMITNVQVA